MTRHLEEGTASSQVERSTARKYALGDRVVLVGYLLELTAPGVFEVVALMPVKDGRPQYRVKSRDERYERVVTEDDISLDVNNRSRRPLFGR